VLLFELTRKGLPRRPAPPRREAIALVSAELSHGAAGSSRHGHRSWNRKMSSIGREVGGDTVVKKCRTKLVAKQIRAPGRIQLRLFGD